MTKKLNGTRNKFGNELDFKLRNRLTWQLEKSLQRHVVQNCQKLVFKHAETTGKLQVNFR